MHECAPHKEDSRRKTIMPLRGSLGDNQENQTVSMKVKKKIGDVAMK